MLDPSHNPYTPGAGQQPAVLTGRDGELREFDARLRRLERGRSAQCTLVVGLRGVGKTVLLNRFARMSLDRDWVVVDHELTMRGDLLQTLAALARQALLELQPPSAWARKAHRVGSLLRSMEATYQIGGLSLTLPSPAVAEVGASGDAARDITELLVSLGEVAREAERGVAFVFDELQLAAVEPLGALMTGLHKVAQRELPLTWVAAGLPQTRGVLAEASSYSERMFETRTVEALAPDEARLALSGPASEEEVEFEPAALEEAVAFTEGYPFFLQVMGDHLWKLAESSPITRSDVVEAAPRVRSWLDRGFFTFRTDGLTLLQRRYLRAMAEVEGREKSSGDVATVLGAKSSAAVGQVRDLLIRKGLIYSPRLGYAAFTVPQFDDYLKRHFELERHRPRGRSSADEHR